MHGMHSPGNAGAICQSYNEVDNSSCKEDLSGTQVNRWRRTRREKQRVAQTLISLRTKDRTTGVLLELVLMGAWDLPSPAGH